MKMGMKRHATILVSCRSALMSNTIMQYSRSTIRSCCRSPFYGCLERARFRETKQSRPSWSDTYYMEQHYAARRASREAHGFPPPFHSSHYRVGGGRRPVRGRGFGRRGRNREVDEGSLSSRGDQNNGAHLFASVNSQLLIHCGFKVVLHDAPPIDDHNLCSTTNSLVNTCRIKTGKAYTYSFPNSQRHTLLIPAPMQRWVMMETLVT